MKTALCRVFLATWQENSAECLCIPDLAEVAQSTGVSILVPDGWGGGVGWW